MNNDEKTTEGTKAINRRSFLKGAIAAGAVAASGAALTACSAGAQNASEGTSASSGAEQDGVVTADILKQKWSFEIATEPIADSEIDETFEADVVVIGAGTAGLLTANSAADQGLKVHVVTASEFPVSRGGSNNATYSKAMERVGLPRTSLRHMQKELLNGAYNMDTKKWGRWYNNSENAMNWVIDIMENAGYVTGIEETTPVDPESLFAIPATSHGWMKPDDLNGPAMGQPFLVQEFADRLAKMGGAVFYKNIGKQLVRGGVANGTEGRVDAIIAQREDGSYAKYIGTKAVVLATGDFSANRDMMARYCPSYVDAISDDMYDTPPNYDAGFQHTGLYKGEGHQMGLWVGAAWQKAFPNCHMGGIMSPGPTKGYATHWGLIIDDNGERFIDEYSVAPVAGESILLQDKSVAYAIWDTGYATNPGSWSSANTLMWPPVGEEIPYPSAEIETAAWDERVDAGMYVKGDTIESVIEQLGLPASTIETVNRYNEYARSGEDLEFHKRPDMLFEIKEGPFYGQKAEGKMCMTVLGGLRTNAYMQVCDVDDEAIPGLYNVGTMVGDVFKGSYTFMTCGANLGINCITFGYLTGQYIAENE